MRYLRFNETRVYRDGHGPRAVWRVVARQDLLGLVAEAIHPAWLGELPPSPQVLARKGVEIGLSEDPSEFFEEVLVWHRH